MQNNLLNQIKKLFKKIFQEISKDFIKNDFELMISIYIFTKKESIYFLYFICIQFSKRLFTLIVLKEFITKFQFRCKNYFTCFYYKRINLYNFIYKSISICFHLRKVTYTNY